MIRSMTGFGRSKLEIDNRQYTIEIKSVNNRYSDISVKLPRNISYLEEKVKNVVSKAITRGKIDIFITFNNYSTKGKDVKINKELAKIYIQNLKEISLEENLSADISVVDITRFPEVLVIENNEDEDLIWDELSKVLSSALEGFIHMKQIEGEKIAADLLDRCANITGQIDEISTYSSRLVEEYIVKLETRIKELTKTDVVDENRLAQEIVIYSDKCSVEEEIVRLKSHIDQFEKLIQKEDASIGKKLDFIIQEMNREINTIGSKANSLDITNRVIEVKTQIENIREQVQNIE